MWVGKREEQREPEERDDSFYNWQIKFEESTQLNGRTHRYKYEIHKRTPVSGSSFGRMDGVLKVN